MKKCKQKSECGKNICCFECEEKNSCGTACVNPTNENCENLIDDTEGALAQFKTEHVELIKKIATFKITMDSMKQQEKELHEQLEKAMELYGVKSFVNENIRITYVEAHTQNKFSTEAFKKDHPDMYESYKKESPVKASVKIEKLDAGKAVRK